MARAGRTAAVLLLSALGAGCSKGQAPSPDPAAGQPKASASAGAMPMPPVGEGGPAGSMGPPLVVELTQKEASASQVVLVATFQASSKLPFPLSVKAVAPAKARLAEGQAEESIPVEQKGTFTRTYKLALTEPLTVDAPFRLVVDGRSGAMGLHAEKAFPAK